MRVIENKTLKPCPFCGTSTNLKLFGTVESWIVCGECGVSTNPCSSIASTITKWNTRVQDFDYETQEKIKNVFCMIMFNPQLTRRFICEEIVRIDPDKKIVAKPELSPFLGGQ